MIKKTGYALISVLLFGNFEAFVLGYGNFLLYTTVLTMIITSDILIFNFGISRKLKAIEVNREIKKSLGRKGEFLEVHLKFSNPQRNTVYFHYYDTLSTIFKVDGQAEDDISLKYGETVERTYRIASKAVGKYRIGPIIVYAEDSLRLCITSYVLAPDDQVRIAPSLSEISTFRSDLLSNFMFTQGVHLSRSVGQGYNFLGIRQYEESDEFRYVAWSRYGSQNGEDLYVKQMEDERTIDVVFVLDYSNGVNQGTEEFRLFDEMITSIISASYSILKNHDGVGFLLNSSTHDYYIKPQKSSKGIEEFERVIAGLMPDGTFRLRDAIEKVKDNVKKEALIFILTPFAFSESFRSHDGGFSRPGKPTSLFLVNRYDFVEKSSDQTVTKLLQSAGLEEERRLKGISSFFNSVGVKTRVVNRKQIFVRLMSEYKYGKVVM